MEDIRKHPWHWLMMLKMNHMTLPFAADAAMAAAAGA